VVDVEGEAAAASTDRVMVAESAKLAPLASGVVEEAQGLAVRELKRTIRCRRLVQIAAIRLVEGALAGALAARAHCVAVVWIVPAALSQRHLAGLRGSQIRLISAPV
jgi:hypothetical protein